MQARPYVSETATIKDVDLFQKSIQILTLAQSASEAVTFFENAFFGETLDERRNLFALTEDRLHSSPNEQETHPHLLQLYDAFVIYSSLFREELDKDYAVLGLIGEIAELVEAISDLSAFLEELTPQAKDIKTLLKELREYVEDGGTFEDEEEENSKTEEEAKQEQDKKDQETQEKYLGRVKDELGDVVWYLTRLAHLNSQTIESLEEQRQKKSASFKSQGKPLPPMSPSDAAFWISLQRFFSNIEAAAEKRSLRKKDSYSSEVQRILREKTPDLLAFIGAFASGRKTELRNGSPSRYDDLLSQFFGYFMTLSKELELSLPAILKQNVGKILSRIQAGTLLEGRY